MPPRRQKWNSYPTQTVPEVNAFIRKLPVWTRLVILVTTLSVGTVVLSNLLTWTPQAITQQPTSKSAASSGILQVVTEPPTSTKAKVVVDGTIGIKVLNDHLESKPPTTTMEGWKHVPFIDKPEDRLDAFEQQPTMTVDNATHKRGGGKGRNKGNKQQAVDAAPVIAPTLEDGETDFWLSYPVDEQLSKCGTYAPSRQLVRICSQVEMQRFRFFQIRSSTTMKALGRGVDWMIPNATRTQRTLQFVYHPVHYQAWSIAAHTRLHLTCESANRVSLDSNVISGSQMWMPVFGNISGPTVTLKGTDAPHALLRGGMAKRSTAQAVELLSLDRKFTSEDATSGPLMYLQSMRNSRFAASKDDTVWATGNNETDTEDIVRFLVYADVRRQCLPAGDTPAQANNGPWPPAKGERRRKAKREADSCYGKEYYPRTPYHLPLDDPIPLLPMIGTFRLPSNNSDSFSKAATPNDTPSTTTHDTASIVRHTLTNWALLAGTQPLMLLDTNQSIKLAQSVRERVAAKFADKSVLDPRRGARRLLSAYLSSVAAAANGTTTNPQYLAPPIDIRSFNFEIHAAYEQPTYRGLFHEAFKTYPYAPSVVYSNMDTMYTSSFVASVRAVEDYVRKAREAEVAQRGKAKIRGWIMVGLRHNFQVTSKWSPLSDPFTWESQVNSRLAARLDGHQSEDVEYVVVSRGLFDWMNSVPDFVVGGMGFDSWIINKVNVLAKSGEALAFDATATAAAIHQLHTVRKNRDQPKSQYNARLASENGGSSLGSVGDVTLALEFSGMGGNISVYNKHRLFYG